MCVDLVVMVLVGVILELTSKFVLVVKNRISKSTGHCRFDLNSRFGDEDWR